MPARNRYPAKYKPLVIARDGDRCLYCGGPSQELDHLIPRRHGGPHAIWNLGLACESCNKRKHSRADGHAIDHLIRNLRLRLDETRLQIDYILALGRLRARYR